MARPCRIRRTSFQFSGRYVSFLLITPAPQSESTSKLQITHHDSFSPSQEILAIRSNRVFWPKYHITSFNEIGQIKTPLFDAYRSTPKKFVSAGRRNQHASRIRSPIRLIRVIRGSTLLNRKTDVPPPAPFVMRSALHIAATSFFFVRVRFCNEFRERSVHLHIV